MESSNNIVILLYDVHFETHMSDPQINHQSQRLPR